MTFDESLAQDDLIEWMKSRILWKNRARRFGRAVCLFRLSMEYFFEVFKVV